MSYTWCDELLVSNRFGSCPWNKKQCWLVAPFSQITDRWGASSSTREWCSYLRLFHLKSFERPEKVKPSDLLRWKWEDRRRNRKVIIYHWPFWRFVTHRLLFFFSCALWIIFGRHKTIRITNEHRRGWKICKPTTTQSQMAYNCTNPKCRV